MGVCNSCVPKSETEQGKDLRRAIEKQKIGTLERSMEESNINEDFYSCRGVYFTPLSYALLKGKLKSFQYMVETMGCSIEIMEQRLEKQGTSGLKIITELGYLNLLEYCISFYTSRDERPQEVTLSMDLDCSTQLPIRSFRTYTAAHTSCENGHIPILNYLKDYFSPEHLPPHQLDIHGVDDYTGENCAMIACRTGNFTMIKFLHEVCQANFSLRNKRHENCILVAISGSRKRSLRNYLNCIIYLVEVVGLDLIEQHEEALLLAENPSIICYIENQLMLRGIFVKKYDLEIENEVHSFPNEKHEKEVWLDSYEGIDFQIKRLIEEDHDNLSLSIISAINFEERNMATPFISTIISFVSS